VPQPSVEGWPPALLFSPLLLPGAPRAVFRVGSRFRFSPRFCRGHLLRWAALEFILLCARCAPTSASGVCPDPVGALNHFSYSCSKTELSCLIIGCSPTPLPRFFGTGRKVIEGKEDRTKTLRYGNRYELESARKSGSQRIDESGTGSSTAKGERMRKWDDTSKHKSSLSRSIAINYNTIFTVCQLLFKRYSIRKRRLERVWAKRALRSFTRRNRGFKMTEKRCQFRNWYPSLDELRVNEEGRENQDPPLPKPNPQGWATCPKTVLGLASISPRVRQTSPSARGGVLGINPASMARPNRKRSGNAKSRCTPE
jgi:hypothetical protein